MNTKLKLWNRYCKCFSPFFRFNQSDGKKQGIKENYILHNLCLWQCFIFIPEEQNVNFICKSNIDFLNEVWNQKPPHFYI